MKYFDREFLDKLSDQARVDSRKRKNRNIHQNFQDPCQRLFNAIEPGSYIRPHRHAADPKDELLIAVRGEFALLLFDELGVVTQVLRFGSEEYGRDLAVGAEIPATMWHTVIALEPGCVLFEVKAGPFDQSQPKELASWAPEEGSPSAPAYLMKLIEWAATEADAGHR